MYTKINYIWEEISEVLSLVIGFMFWALLIMESISDAIADQFDSLTNKLRSYRYDDSDIGGNEEDIKMIFNLGKNLGNHII